MNKNSKVLGITEQVNTCDCCGKSDLKRTVAIMDMETQEINYYGTTCAAKVEKFSCENEVYAEYLSKKIASDIATAVKYNATYIGGVDAFSAHNLKRA